MKKFPTYPLIHMRPTYSDITKNVWLMEAYGKRSLSPGYQWEDDKFERFNGWFRLNTILSFVYTGVLKHGMYVMSCITCPLLSHKKIRPSHIL